MELVGVVVVGVLVLAGTFRRRAHRDPRTAGVPLGVDPADAAELTAVADRLLWERLTARSGRLAARLRLILARGTPPRAIAPLGHDGRWVVTFADGSEVAVRALRAGDGTDLLIHLARGRAALCGHHFEGDDVVLEFTAGPRRVSLVALDA